MKKTTNYKGISKYYFYLILNTIINIADLKNVNDTILDFGCGIGKLKEILSLKKVIGYDINPLYSEVDDWTNLEFKYFVANQVFYSMNPNQLIEILTKLRVNQPSVSIIVGTSRVGLLNKLGMIILNRKDAHEYLKITPKQEHKIISKFCKLIRKKNVLFLSDVYLYKFK